MSLEVRWSYTAEITFDAVYDFALNQWGVEIAEKLRAQVLRTLKQISLHPLSFQESSLKNVRKAVVSTYISFFHEIFEEHILLVFFWDNRQQPFFNQP